MSKSFQRGLSEETVATLAERWTDLREQAIDDMGRLGVDLVLQALYARLRREPERVAAIEQVHRNPQSSGVGLTQGEVTDEMIESVRGLVSRAAGAGMATGVQGGR
jgi:hypothetical protein